LAQFIPFTAGLPKTKLIPIFISLFFWFGL